MDWHLCEYEDSHILTLSSILRMIVFSKSKSKADNSRDNNQGANNKHGDPDTLAITGTSRVHLQESKTHTLTSSIGMFPATSQ